MIAVAAAFALTTQTDPATGWLESWKANIVAESQDRYCGKENGEELGWLMSPFLNGYSYGYLATGDTAWIDRLIDWTDAWLKRGIKEPDGFIGWPKEGGTGLSGDNDPDQFTTDSLLGEAMAFAPVVRISGVILRSPKLKDKYGDKATGYLRVAETDFKKWSSRGAWRQEAGVWVVPAFGIGTDGKWTKGYDDRLRTGFTNPANKQNLIAEWELSLYDATGKAIYKDRATAWFETMKHRIRPNGSNELVWNYWDPAGPWDYKADGSTRHWVGVHPNGGYYGIDVGAVVTAYEHNIVFTKADIDKLIATNHAMWNGKVEGARFGRIDGGEPDPRWANSPGVLWSPLCRYDVTLARVFEANLNPKSWGGIAETPWYLYRRKESTR